MELGRYGHCSRRWRELLGFDYQKFFWPICLGIGSLWCVNQQQIQKKICWQQDSVYASAWPMRSWQKLSNQGPFRMHLTGMCIEVSFIPEMSLSKLFVGIMHECSEVIFPRYYCRGEMVRIKARRDSISNVGGGRAITSLEGGKGGTTMWLGVVWVRSSICELIRGMKMIGDIVLKSTMFQKKAAGAFWLPFHLWVLCSGVQVGNF